MRIGSADNLTLDLLHRDLFGPANLLAKAPAQVNIGVDVFNSIDVGIVAQPGDSAAACSHPCDAAGSGVGETDVPRPGDDGYPVLPMNGATAGGVDAGTGNLLDVMA